MNKNLFPFSELISDTRLIQKNETYSFEIHEISFKSSDVKFIITDGLCQYEQNTNEQNKDLKRIELYFCLPSYFDLSEKSWPILWLNKIAQIPQKNETWFGNGDTIPSGNPPKKLDDNFDANHFVLSRPIQLSKYLSTDKIQADDFKLLAVIPIFQNEFDYKMRNSHQALFDLFEKKGLGEKVDVFRKSVCRKRILGLL